MTSGSAHLSSPISSPRRAGGLRESNSRAVRSDLAEELTDDVHDAVHGIVSRHEVRVAAQRVVQRQMHRWIDDHADLVAAVRELLTEAALARACEAGVTAVWAPNTSATIQLAHLFGPHDVRLTRTEAATYGLTTRGPWRLADPDIRTAVYRHQLTHGNQFGIYRTVNLLDLAQVFPRLTLPHGVAHEWARALDACGLHHTDEDRGTGT